MIERYLDKAQALADAQLPDDALLPFLIAYRQADLLIAKGKRDEAIVMLEQSVAMIDAALNFDSPLEQQMRIRLVKLYEHTDQPEKVTAQCVALGKLVPRSDNIEQVPLYRISPSLHNIYWSKNTSIHAQFDITAQGTVSNIEILNVDGSKRLVKPFVEALKKWRYAPKFEDGVPVTAKSTIQMDFKFTKA
ncbi:TonB domain protein [Pseudoalteromonas luteoviolacea B = ATCC 29581]|nr:TonB domain protein [Pseudoalteromonas luteoviolacea B = ATCC 29581]